MQEMVEKRMNSQSRWWQNGKWQMVKVCFGGIIH
jgi:hypothetical protein